VIIICTTESTKIDVGGLVGFSFLREKRRTAPLYGVASLFAVASIVLFFQTANQTIIMFVILLIFLLINLCGLIRAVYWMGHESAFEAAARTLEDKEHR